MGNRSANPFSFLSSLGSRMGHSKKPRDVGSTGEAAASAVIGAGAAIQRAKPDDSSGSQGMRDDLAAQYDVLIRELCSLDALLRDVPQWDTLCRAERALARGGAERSSAQEKQRQTLREARQHLSQNRVFVARERIVEAVLLICEEMGRKAPVDALYPIADEPSQGIAGSETREGLMSPDASNVHATIRTSPQSIGGVTKFERDPNRPPDDLTKIRSIGLPMANKLNALGIHHYSQIASWNAHDVASVRAALSLGGRIARENWIEQAAMLASPTLSNTDAKNGGRIDGEMKRKKATARSRATPKTPNKSRAAKKATDATRVSDAANAIFRKIQSKPAVSEAAVASAPTRARDKVHEPVEANERNAKRSVETKTRAPGRKKESVGETKAAKSRADRLQAIRGIDDAMARKLAKAGVTKFAQISAWQARDIADIGAVVSCRERIARECWIEQAAVLAKANGATAYSSHVAQGVPYQQTATLIAWGGEHAVLPDVTKYWTRNGTDGDTSREAAVNGQKESAKRLTPPPLNRDRGTTKQPDRNGVKNAESSGTAPRATTDRDKPLAAAKVPRVPNGADKTRVSEASGTLKDRLKSAATNDGGDKLTAAHELDDSEAGTVAVSQRAKKPSLKSGMIKTFAAKRKASSEERGEQTRDGRSSTASYGQYSGHIGEASVSIIRGGKSGASGDPETDSDVADASIAAGQTGHIEIDYSYGQNSGGFARRWLRALLGR